jgi:hypothetical protein
MQSYPVGSLGRGVLKPWTTDEPVSDSGPSEAICANRIGFLTLLCYLKKET